MARDSFFAGVSSPAPARTDLRASFIQVRHPKTTRPRWPRIIRDVPAGWTDLPESLRAAILAIVRFGIAGGFNLGYISLMEAAKSGGQRVDCGKDAGCMKRQRLVLICGIVAGAYLGGFIYMGTNRNLGGDQKGTKQVVYFVPNKSEYRWYSAVYAPILYLLHARIGVGSNAPPPNPEAARPPLLSNEDGL